MPTQIGELGVTFPDTTLQTTAAIPGTPGFGLTVMTVFTNNGFFVVPAGITRVRVTVIGGGGSGGVPLIASTSEGPEIGMAGGGGGGGTAIKTITGLTPGASINVVVGAGGAGVGGGPYDIGLNGNTGSTSSFGAYCSATGGGRGFGSYDANVGQGGTGGIGVSGDLNINGSDGGYGGFSFRTSSSIGPLYGAYNGIGGGTYMAGDGNSNLYGGGSYGGNPSSTGAKGVVIVEY